MARNALKLSVAQYTISKELCDHRVPWIKRLNILKIHTCKSLAWLLWQSFSNCKSQNYYRTPVWRFISLVLGRMYNEVRSWKNLPGPVRNIPCITLIIIIIGHRKNRRLGLIYRKFSLDFRDWNVAYYVSLWTWIFHM